MADWMRDYLQTVGGQIRWKQVRPSLLAELADHLTCQYEAYRAEGLPEETARIEALRQMGDAVRVGQELDRTHRPRPQWGLLSLTVLLAVAGAALRCTVARGSSVGEPERVAFYLALGLLALFGCYFLDYTFLGRRAGLCYGGAILLGLCSLLLSPQYAGTSYYTRYFVVMVYPVVYAAVVWRLSTRGWLGFWFSLAALLPLAVICLLAPALLGLLLLCLTAAVVLSVALARDWFGIPRWQGFVVLAGTVFAVMMWLLAGGGAAALLRRLTYALNPDIDPMGYGYMGVQIREALTRASLWGPVDVNVLPGWDTDALLVSIVTRLGWIPCGLLLLALTVLLVWGAVRMLHQPSSLGQLVSLAVLLTLGLQGIVSVATNLGFVFLSATCPFIMGNLHSVLDLALTGLMLSVFRRAQAPMRTRRRRRLVIRFERVS